MNAPRNLFARLFATAAVTCAAALALAAPAPARAETFKPTGWDDTNVFTTGEYAGISKEITYVVLENNDTLDLSDITEAEANGVRVFVEGEAATIIGNPDVCFEDLDLSWQGNTGLTNTILNIRDFRYQGNNTWSCGSLTVNYSGSCEFAGYISSGTNLGFVLTSADEVTFDGAEGAHLTINSGSWSGASQGDGTYAGTFAFEGGAVTVEGGMHVTGELIIKDCNLTVKPGENGNNSGIWIIRNWNEWDQFPKVGLRIENSTVVSVADSELGSTGAIHADYDDYYPGSYIEIVDSQVTATSVTSKVNYSSAHAAIGDAESIVIDNSTINAEVVQGARDTVTGGAGAAAVGGHFHELTIRNGSDVTAAGLWGAGVGTGGVAFEQWRNTDKESSTISIADSTVDASSRLGSGIGGGMIGHQYDMEQNPIPPVNITISGVSDVTARSASGAAIGGGRVGYVQSPVGILVPLAPTAPGVWDPTEGGSGSAETRATAALRAAAAASSGIATLAADPDEFPAGLATLTIEGDVSGEPVIKCESGTVAVSAPVTADKPMMEYTLAADVEAPEMTMPVNRSLVSGTDAGAGAPSYDLRAGFRSLAFWPVADGTYELTYGTGSAATKLVDASDESVSQFTVPAAAASGDALSSFTVKPEGTAQPTGAPEPEDFSFVYTTERIVYPANLVDLYEDEECEKRITLTENIISDYIGETIYARYKTETGTGDEYVTPITVPDFAAKPNLEAGDVSATFDSITFTGTKAGTEYGLLAEGETTPQQVLVATEDDRAVTFTGLTQGTTYTLIAHVGAVDGQNGHFRSLNATLEVKTKAMSDYQEIALSVLQSDYLYTGDEVAFRFEVAAGQEGIATADVKVTYYYNGVALPEGELPGDMGTYTVVLDHPGTDTYAPLSRMFIMRILPQASITVPEDGATVTYDGSPVAYTDLRGDGLRGSYGSKTASSSDFTFVSQEIDENGNDVGMQIDGLPTDVGTYRVEVTLNDKTVDGQPYLGVSDELTLAVAPKGLPLSWGNQYGRVFGDNKGSVTCEISSPGYYVVSGDDVRVELGYSCTHEGDDHLTAGEHKAVAKLVGADAENYTISSNAEKTYTVAKSTTEVALSATAANPLVYGDDVELAITLKPTGKAATGSGSTDSGLNAGEFAVFLEGASGDQRLSDQTYTSQDATSEVTQNETYDTTAKVVPVRESKLVVKFAGSDNMAPAESASVSLTLDPKTVMASIVADEGVLGADGKVTKVYDGTATAPDGLSIELGGIEGADGVSAAPDEYVYDADSVAAATTITASGLKLTGADASFYTLGDAADPTIDAAITPRSIADAVVVLGDQLVYNGEQQKQLIKSVTMGGLDATDSVDVTGDTATEAGSYTMTLTGKGNFTGEKQVEFAVAQSGSAFGGVATYNDGEQTSDFTYGDTVTVKGTIEPTGAAPAANALALDGPRADEVALYYKGTQISEAAAVEDDGSFELAYDTTSRAVPVGEKIGLEVRYVGTPDMAGTAATVTVELAKAVLTPSITGAASKTYDGTTDVTGATESTLAIALEGAQGSDAPKASASFSFADKNTGEGVAVNASSIALDEGSDAWYELAATELAANLGTITPAPLAVSARDASITYGDDPAPALAIDYDGFVNGETADVLSGAPTVSTAYEQGQDVGDYDIAVSVDGVTAQNYALTPAGATLTVEARTVAIAWTDPGRVVGDGQTLTAAIANVYGEDDVSLTLEGHDADTAGAHTAQVTGLAGADAGNYALPAAGDASLTKDYVVAQSATEFPEDGVTVANGEGVETSSFTYGERVVVTVTPEASGTPAAENGVSTLAAAEPDQMTLWYRPADGGEDVLLAGPVDTGENGSYALAYDTSAKLVPVGAATLVARYEGTADMASAGLSVQVTLSARQLAASVVAADGGADVSKTYDGTVAAPDGAQVALDGVLPGDEVSATWSSLAFDDKNVDLASKVTATGVTLDGAQAGFYAVPSLVEGDAVIAPATITLTVREWTIPYGTEDMSEAATAGLKVAYSGLVDGETIESLVASGAITGAETVTVECPELDATSLAGSTGAVVINLNDIAARNYVFVTDTEGVRAEVVPAQPTVTEGDPALEQKLEAGSTVADLAAPAVLGVDGEPLEGALTWYADSGMTEPLSADLALGAGARTLWWRFEPADANYEAVSGSAAVTVAEASEPAPGPGPSEPPAEKPDGGESLARTGDPTVLGLPALLAGSAALLGARALRRRG